MKTVKKMKKICWGVNIDPPGTLRVKLVGDFSYMSFITSNYAKKALKIVISNHTKNLLYSNSHIRNPEHESGTIYHRKPIQLLLSLSWTNSIILDKD